MIYGILTIFIFAAMAILMFSRKLPALLALPVMAFLIALVSRVPVADLLNKIIAGGSIRLSVAMVTVFFGAILGHLMKNTGVAKTMIRMVAELSGDNPIWVSVILTAVNAVLFTVIGGLGAVIMVASIVLPIMLSMGIPPVAAGSIFLIGLSLGGILNLANWQLYMSILGLSQAQVLKFALPLFFSMALMAAAFLLIELRRGRLSYLWAVNPPPDESGRAPLIALLTPFIPLGLVLGFSIFTSYEFPIIAAMLAGIVYCVATTASSPRTISKSVIEGISASAPAIALLIGIGMLLNAVLHPRVAGAIQPLIASVLPSGRISYVIFFSLLAPLSLYRGPLNIWGLGSGIIGIMLAAGTLSPAAIMAAMLSVGQIQGVSDPTNTHNVWIANHLRISVHDILKKTLPYVWIVAVIGLIISVLMFFPSVAHAAARWSGTFEAVYKENNPVFIEASRVRVNNVKDGSIDISLDAGRTWKKIGSVLYPTNVVSNTGYTASRWIEEGDIAAVAVNAIHIKTDYNFVDDRGVIFSILPRDQLSVPEYYNSYISPNSSIYTDISAGELIFGGEYSPFVGNQVSTSDAEGNLFPVGLGFEPRIGDVFVMVVERPAHYPKEVIFENRFGGLITLRYLYGESKVIGTVLKPVVGVGRFLGTKYSDIGRIRANHPGVLDVSTASIGEIGGFQIIPAAHGMSDEMITARVLTQWMVVGPVSALDPSPEGVAPLFKYFVHPRYVPADIFDEDWDRKALERFLVEVKYKDEDSWRTMPEISLNPDLRMALPYWANKALKNISHFRILFPIYREEK